MIFRFLTYLAVIAMGAALGVACAGAFMVLYTMAENFLRYNGAI